LVYRKEALIKRLEKLKEYHNDLDADRSLSLDGYKRDKQTRYATERLLFLISENILDFLDHILSARFEVVSDSYEEIIENAFKREIIDKALYSRLKGLGGFRNVLAHEYLRIDDEEVFRHRTRMSGMLNDLIEAFGKII